MKRTFKDSSVRAGLVFISLFILLSSLVGAYYERHEPKATVTDNRSIDLATDYKNLDLGIAKQAIYTNSALKLIKNVGIKGGVQEKLFNFNVPKDGLSEYGLMTTPLGPPPKGGWPVLILCHGYTRPSYYSTLRDYLPDMQFYSQHGFAVIKPDFRGQGYSSGHGAPDGAFYSMSYNTDVMSLIAAIKQTSYLNRSNINIWGHSMGGFIALRAAVLSPDVKSVVLLSAPVGTAKDMYKLYTPISDTDNITARNIRNNVLALYGTPLSNPNYWDKVSPLNYLNDLQAYIQIYAGQDDRIVPPRFSKDLDSSLTKLHKAHSYTVYSRGNHGLLPQRQLIWRTSLKQLEQAKI